jgi:hypothetical protein
MSNLPDPANETLTNSPPIEQPATPAPPADGRFQKGNTFSLKHGGFSEQVKRALLPEQAAILESLAEKRAEIERDLGGAETLSVLTRDLANRYLELCVVADYLGGKLVTEGPLTPKGNQRAALTAYLGVIDRLQRLALTLGLERRQKPVNPLDAVRHAVEEANKR